MPDILTARERIYLKNILRKHISELYVEDIIMTRDQEKEFRSKRPIINSNYPLDYLIGSVHIPELDLNLTVNTNTLIPRPETIEWIKTCVLEDWLSNITCVCEIGTGTGLISIYLAKQGYRMIATDISKDALEVAIYNAQLNNVGDRISFYQHNLLGFDISQHTVDQNWALIANLPYVPLGDKELESYESIKHEPEIALFSGEDGLDATHQLLQQIESLVHKPDVILLELDPRNIRFVADSLHSKWEVTVHLDENGLERLLQAKRVV